MTYRPLFFIAVALAGLGAASAASAQAVPAQPAATQTAPPPPPQPPASGGLTWNGLTLYGAIDFDLVYETHGAPNSPIEPTVTQYLLSKSSNRSIFTLAGNGISNSFVGLKGEKALTPGWTASFAIETAFDPLSGRLSDGPGSYAAQNGKPLTAQTTSGDSARAGQPFNQAAYLALSNARWGRFSFGRQTSVLTDGVLAYDPQQAAYAFSLIGYSGVTAGGGSAEDSRLDQMFKYAGRAGPVNFGAMYQFPGTLGSRDTAVGANLGLKTKLVSLDAYYMHKNDAVVPAALTQAQLVGVPDPSHSIAAIISDNTALALMARSDLKRVRLYAGIEQITFRDPAEPVPSSATDIGDYVIVVPNNVAFPRARVLDVSWAGTRYQASRKLELAAAIYHYGQNSYGLTGCSTAASATCSGELYMLSFTSLYHLSPHFDTYAGVIRTQISGGLSSGYLKTSNEVSTMGVRFSF